MIMKSLKTQVKICDPTAYNGKIYIEADDDFYLNYLEEIVNWSVPDWKSLGFPELAGPFPSVEQAQWALRRNLHNLNFFGYEIVNLVTIK